MLNRNDIALLIEKAVAWDKSIIGKTSNGAGSLFSFLKGKIKTGMNKAKIRSLVTNWGVEYLKAVQAVDKNLPAPDTTDHNPLDQNGQNTEDAIPTTEEPNESNDNFAEFSSKLSQGPDAIKALNSAFGNLDKWLTINNQAGYDILKKEVQTNGKWVSDEDFSQICEDFLINKSDSDRYASIIEKLRPIILEIQKEDSTPFTFSQALKSTFNLKTFKDTIKNSVRKDLDSLSVLYDNASIFVQNYQMMLKTLDAINKSAPETRDEAIDNAKKTDQSIIKYFQNQNLNSESFNPDYLKTIKSYLKLMGQNVTESILLEAEAKLLQYVLDIVEGVDLKEFESVPKIKDKTLAKINFKMLDIIRYQANYIIDKAKNSTNPKEKQESTELQKEWDLGIKNVNSLFQNVIDTDQVMKNVKPNDVSAEVKAQLKEADNKIDVLKGLQVEDALSTSGGKFLNDDLYLFNVNFKTSLKKVVEGVYLGVSPLSKMVEENDGTQYFWHRLFGAYSYDQTTNKISRQNPFKDITSNLSLITNFDDQENMYYIVFKRQAVSKTYEYAYIYSNKGSLIWKNKVYPKVDDNAKQTIEATKKNPNDLLKYGNVFQIKVNGRYLVDRAGVEKYPGIQLKDLKNEQNYQTALTNHDDLIKILFGQNEK